MPDLFSRNVTVFVNSSDGFSDCWAPFFTLLDRHWSEHGPVLLNTETTNWAAAPAYVKCSQVAQNEAKPLSWSECLMRGLSAVSTPLVLYMQEDYFIEKSVRHDVITQAVEKMVADETIGHIALTRHASLPPYLPYEDDRFQKIAPNARYRISTQAALWRPEVLLSYLDPSENGWAFEILGSMRARRRPDTFLVARYDDGTGGPAIDYTHTGVIKGRWHTAMPALFANNGISVDFDRRGFYAPPNPILAKFAVARKLAERPKHVIRQLLSR